MAKRTEIGHESLNPVYQFVGIGWGIPGLPHEVSLVEAEKFGLAKELKAAIENGSYAPVEESAIGRTKIDQEGN